MAMHQVTLLCDALLTADNWKITLVGNDGMTCVDVMPLVLFSPLLRDALIQHQEEIGPTVIMFPDYSTSSLKLLVRTLKEGTINIDNKGLLSLLQLTDLLNIDFSSATYNIENTEPHSQCESIKEHAEETSDCRKYEKGFNTIQESPSIQQTDEHDSSHCNIPCAVKPNEQKREILEKSSLTSSPRKLIHQKRRTYICTVCNQPFNTLKSFQVHKLTEHSDLRKYKCETCKRLFASEKVLNHHMITVHCHDSNMSCQTCFQCFTTRRGLVEHVMFEHLFENMFNLCAICGFAFEERESLEIHWKHCRTKLLGMKVKGIESNKYRQILPRGSSFMVIPQPIVQPRPIQLLQPTTQSQPLTLVLKATPRPNVTIKKINVTGATKTVNSTVTGGNTTNINNAAEQSKSKVAHKITNEKKFHLHNNLHDTQNLTLSDEKNVLLKQEKTSKVQNLIKDPLGRSTAPLIKDDCITYRCLLCDDCQFKSLEILKKHVETTHKELCLHYQCRYCDFRTDKPEDHQQHETENHSEDKLIPFKCKYCDKYIKLKASFISHERLHTDVSKSKYELKCDQCPGFFKDHKTLFIHHVKEHRRKKEELFLGQICKFIVVEKSLLKLSLEKPEKKKIKLSENEDCSPVCKCNLCVYNFNEIRLQYPHKPDNVELLYKCVVCEYSTDSGQNARDHEIEHLGVLLHTCGHCQLCFPTMLTLTNHMEEQHNITEHSGSAHTRSIHKELLYQCKLCRKKLSTSLGIQNHLKKSHFITRTKSPSIVSSFIDKLDFKCKRCEVRFKSRVHLNQHSRSKHAVLSSFGCGLCPKMFRGSFSLKKHMKRCHSTKLSINDIVHYKFQCEFCLHKFSSRKELTGHVNSMHMLDNMYKCFQCDVLYKSKVLLRKHLAMHRKESTQALNLGDKNAESKM